MLYKRGKVWWVKIKTDGEVIRESTGTSSKELARKIEVKLLNEVAEGRWFEKNPAEIVLFREVWERYMVEEARYLAKGTYERAVQCAKNFLPRIGELALKDVTPSVLSSYKAKRLGAGLKPATVAKELQFIRRVFSLCKREWQMVKQSPFEFFKMPSADEQRVSFLEPGQFENLLVSAPAWLTPIITLARYTGMRRGNILELTLSQVDMQNRVINLDRTKNGDRLKIPLTDSAFKVLHDVRQTRVFPLHCPFVFHEDGKPYSPDKVSVAFKRTCKRAGVENFRFHDLRHDFASNLVQKGNDLYVVQRLLGHRDGRMTQRYAHLKVENLREAVGTLDGGHKKGHSGNEAGLKIAATD